MPAPEISVLMPVRNALGTLREAVESVRCQTWRDWELVVVDDGSQDGSAEWLEEMARVEPRMRVERQPALGIVAALQAGFERCRGTLVARMDADDAMQPERLERQRACLLAQREVGLVASRVRYGGDLTGYGAHVEWINSLLSHEAMSLRRFVEAPVAHPSVMFRREVMEVHGGYREGDFPEDYELWLRWLEAGVRFAKLPEELLVWKDRPERLSRQEARYSVEAFHQVKSGYLQRWLQAHAGNRAVWLWGAGRVTRRRFESLPSLAGFIDVDPAKIGSCREGKLIRSFEDLPDVGTSFIVAGVAARGVREEIAAYLTARGWVEGADFLLAA